jgi:hypothetical protein
MAVTVVKDGRTVVLEHEAHIAAFKAEGWVEQTEQPKAEKAKKAKKAE